MGIDLRSLFKVSTQIFGSTQTAKVKIAGGILLKVSDPLGNVKPGINPLIWLFYVATNVKHTLLSLAMLCALRVMNHSFLR